MSSRGMIKSASFPLLQTAMESSNDNCYKSFITKIADKDLQAPIVDNPYMSQAVKAVIDYDMPVKEASINLKESLLPDVIQVRRKPDGDYLVKSASHSAFDPLEVSMSINELMENLPGLPDIPVNTSHIIGTDLRVREQSEGWSKHADVKEPGFYKIINSRGTEKVGSVFHVVTLDNRDTGKWLFTDGNNYAMQQTIIGEKVANWEQPKENLLKPGISGVLCFEKQGSACTTPPFNVDNVTILEGKETFNCTSGFAKMAFSFDTTGLLKQASKSGDTYIIPRTYKFMEMGGKSFKAASAGYQIDNIEKVAAIPMGITIYNRGGHFLLEGEPLKKLANYGELMPRYEAEFALVSAGVHPVNVQEKLAFANKRLKSKVTATRKITPLYELQDGAEKIAAKKMEEALPLVKEIRADTVKIAAAIKDMITLDGLLALNFVTPNNLAIYAGMLPAFEAIQSRVAELLIANRLGMNELPGNALRMAMKQLEKVIIALKGIKVGTEKQEKII